MAAIWILIGIFLAGVAFMVRFFWAMRCELRHRGEGCSVQRIENEDYPHYIFEIADPGDSIEAQHSTQFSRRSGRSRTAAWLMVFALATITARGQTASANATGNCRSSGRPEGEYVETFSQPYKNPFVVGVWGMANYLGKTSAGSGTNHLV